MGLHAQVSDTQSFVGFGRSPPFTVGGIEHMGDAQPAQLPSIGCYVLVSKVEAWPDLIGMVTGSLACEEEPLQFKDTEEGVLGRGSVLQVPRGPSR